MTALRLNETASTSGARDLIDQAIASNGASRVLVAAMIAILRKRPARKPRPPDTSQLGAHLRRDVGLLVEPEAADWRRFQL
jgi:hypothetical protein